MPLKTVKKDAADKLTLEWILHVKSYKLALDKARCASCQVCALACPKEAIRVEKQAKVAGQRARKAKVDIDLAKCNFCGVCDITCPYGAIKLTLNGEHVLSVVDKESFPQLIRDIKADTRHCPKDCVECQDVCPLNLITISKTTYDGKPVTDLEALSPSQRKHVQINLDIKKEYCPTCRVCELKCAPGVIRVRKFMEGKITIDQSKCPEGCQDCLDVCPIRGALVLSEADNKVHVTEAFCDYCGACKIACPVEDALTLTRTKILHTPIESGTWNKVLLRLTSPDASVQELKAKAAQKRKDLVARRFVFEGVIR